MANETILIVEDDEINGRLLQIVLESHGHCPLMAANGQEGVEIARREKPHLVLMDMQMPRMDGYEATQTLKEQPETAHIPIVALTAHAMDGDQERALEAGCDDYLSKPIDTRELPEQVREYLDSWEPESNA